MRVRYKGGVWKNSEDEILKAAVMKYGQNQWPRIASLLVRKSAKQCKARWYEWLDPSIKKTPWSREEEEKLLRLVKIMPTSWRTIAPIIGRTAVQCQEHYEYLLDRAQNEMGEDGNQVLGTSASALLAGASNNRLRGEDADHAPESRPARPDPVDMDEEELEMIGEARARLANTKGKKAKRKAREKQLEEAKRLVQLQKKRDLKAAGITTKPSRRSKKHADYATEIPFEREVVPGFYDTKEEDERATAETQEKKPLGQFLQKFKKPITGAAEEKSQEVDVKKRKKLEPNDILAALRQKANEIPDAPALKRTRLSLPDPVIADSELEKMKKAIENTSKNSEFIGLESDPANNVNEDLHRDVLQSIVSKKDSNTEEEVWEERKKKQLEALIELKSATNPLLGNNHSNVEEPIDQEDVISTAGGNQFTDSSLRSAPSQSKAREERQLAKKRKKHLAALGKRVAEALTTLPAPRNDYEIDLEDDDSTDEDPNNMDVDEQFVEDAEDERKRLEKDAKEIVPVLRDKLLSAVAKSKLPLPTRIHTSDSSLKDILNTIHKDLNVIKVIDKWNAEEMSSFYALQELQSLPNKSLKKSNDETDHQNEDYIKDETESSSDLKDSLFQCLQNTEIVGKRDNPRLPDPSAIDDVSFLKVNEERRKFLKSAVTNYVSSKEQLNVTGSRRMLDKQFASMSGEQLTATIAAMRERLATEMTK